MLSINKTTRIFFIKLRQFTLAALLVYASGVQADALDVYMGTGTSSASETHPNVLFILDTSGSMNARDAGANKRTARMTVLKSAMSDLLSTLDNVNVGLARFSNTGGSVIFPISPINGNANIIVGESTSVQALEFKASLVSNTDDAEERVSGNSTGEVFLHDDTLEAFDFGGTTGQSGTTTVLVASASDDISEFNRNGRMLNTNFAYIHQVVSLGLRFQSVNIAQGATIQSAFLEFTNAFRQTTRTNAVISGLDIANTTTFSTSSRDLSSRATTSATVAWDGIPGGNRNTKFTSPNISSVVQEIVDRSDWQSGNAMGFKVKTSRGARFPHSRNASSTLQPKLRIQMQAVAGSEGDDQLLALRFEDVRIPRGATLNSAKLLVTNSAAGGSDSVVWQIQTEQVDDSAALTSTANNLSSRKTGGSVINWTVDSSTLNTAPSSTQCSVTTSTGQANTCADQFTKSTNELKSIVHEVTNRSGWCGGQSITFLIDASSPTADQIRKLYSKDSAEAALAPKFVYSYMPQKGCMTSLDVSQIASSGDDAEQYADSYSGSRIDTVSDDLVLGEDSKNGNQTVGLRFTAVEVPQGVTIKEAHIEFIAKGTSTGDASYTIKAVNEGNVGPITNRANAISTPPTTSASASWSLSSATAGDDWDTAGAEHSSPDLAAVVQEVVNRSDWSSKNNMGFVITGTGTRIAESFDSDPSRAPRLVVKYDDSKTVPFKSVREVLKEKVKELPARGGTPIAGAMLETAKYFRGETMVHGKHRGSYGQISHPGAYCIASGNCPGATATRGGGGYYGNSGTTDEFFVLNPSGCNKNNLGSSRCRNRKINGNPKYLSPVKSDLECAANHQVLLTDGQAGGRDDTRIKRLIGKRSCHADNSKFKEKDHAFHKYTRKSYYGSGVTSESCVPDLVEYMAEEDQVKQIKGEQNVKTHTVAFALKSAGPVQFLKDVANLGGGGFYSADTAGDLQEVFKVILSEVRSAPTSFAAPSLAVNAFNEVKSRETQYFAMFTPQLTQKWNGNVKKFGICAGKEGQTCKVGETLDVNNNPVVDASDPNNKVFRSDTQSYWSSSKDGNNTTRGGAGGEIIDHTEVKLFTDRASSNPVEQSRGVVLASESGFNMDSTNWNDNAFATMRQAICKTDSTNSGSECEKRMLWLLGKKHITEADSDLNADTRWSVHDVVNSKPVVITYGGVKSTNPNVSDTFFDKIVYGSNAGMLHMVNGETGLEEWRYLPSDFWSMQRQLFDNRQDKHLYGLDMPPTVWKCDVDNNKKINPSSGRDIVNNGKGTCFTADSDFVRVFQATRRGGGDSGFIYALDLSESVSNHQDRVEPIFMWRIAGGNTSGDFRRLAQPWSQPKITTIMVEDINGIPSPKEVLIFGGGYDSKLDDPAMYSVADNGGNDYLGNAIYIVDPMDGRKILSISGKGSGADITVSKMNFSIPSDIVFNDSDYDGLTDRLYVGDLGGQMWRVDLAEAVPETGTRGTGTVVGLLASIGGSSAANQRRFFVKPSVTQVNDFDFSTSEAYDLILAGTGSIPDPLGETVKDRFYAFRDYFVGRNTLQDTDGDNVAEQGDGYPKQNSQAYSHSDPKSLLNITTDSIASQSGSDQDLVKQSDGYYFDFFEANGRAGEKAFTRPIVIGGNVLFSTFDPSSGTSAASASKKNPCSAAPNIGLARAYHFNVLTAEPPITSTLGGGRGANRFRGTIGSGIPSDIVPFFTDSGIVAILQADGLGISLGNVADAAPIKAYWNESVDF